MNDVLENKKKVTQLLETMSKITIKVNLTWNLTLHYRKNP